MRLRPLASLLAALLAGCAPPGAAGAGAARDPSAPGSPKSAGLVIDTGRADAPLLSVLAQLTEEGPVLAGLSEASRADLGERITRLPPEEQTALARSDPALSARMPLLALLVGSRSPEALYAAGCRGGASQDLLAARKPGAPSGDLPASVRVTARRSARAYARALLEERAGGPLLGEREAERLDDVGRVIGSAHLRRAARAYLALISPTPSHAVGAAFGEAWDLDPEAARRRLGLAEPFGPGLEATVREARGDIALAAELERAGGAGASGPPALDAAILAARLGRADLASSLEARSGALPESDLRAAVALAFARLEGSVCGGLDLSRDSSRLCPAAWANNPDVPRLLSLLDRAYASGKGRDPWAVETYLGLRDVLPLSFAMLSGELASPARARELLAGHVKSLGSALRGPGAPPRPRSDALSLFVDVLGDTFALAFSDSEETEIAPDEQRRLIAEAEALLTRAPADPLAARTALAVALALRAPADSAALVEKVPSLPSTDLVRATVGAVAASRARRPAQLAAALGVLSHLPESAEASPLERWQARLLAAELGAATDPSAASLERLDQASREPAPSPPLPDDVLERVIDQVGALARKGKGPEAIARYDEAAGELGRAPADRELLAAFEAEGLALLAAHPESGARRSAAARLRGRVEHPERGIAAELRLYRALWLRHLLEQDERSACGPRDTACRADLAAARRRVGEELAEATRLTPAHNLPLVERGIVPAGGSSNLSLNFGLAAGIGLVIEARPRLLTLPVPPEPPRPAAGAAPRPPR